jgi:uncharacterized protein (DUF1501 family)
VTAIGTDPSGTQLAFHPNMTGLKQLFDAGRVAVVNGVGYANQNLSHFASEDIWFSGNNATGFTSGWFGRYLDAAFTPSDLVAVDVNDTLNPIFVSQDSNVLAIRKLSDFSLPDDPLYPDLAAKKAALDAMYAIEADDLVTSGIQLTIGGNGDVLLSKIDDYAAISTGWSSALDALAAPSSLSRRLKQVASIIRHDSLSPPAPTGARFFHVRIGGFDTHTQQGALTGSQPTLLQRLSQALTAFYDDMVALGVASKVLMVTFSEFGRRVAENASEGTDHGAAGPVFLAGPGVRGGLHGTHPALDALEDGDLAFTCDFRRIYATVLDGFLGFDSTRVLGSRFEPLPLLRR